MRSNRVFVDRALSPDAVVEVGGPAANHIARVLRLGVGDALTAFDGRGGEYEARIDGLRKDTVLIAVGAHRDIERESPLSVTLAQGVSRGERMDLVVQKATELGVRRIVPVLCARSVVRLDARQADAKLRHWRAIAIAACEQCGRNTVPWIAAPVPLFELLSEAAEDALRLLLDPGAQTTPRDGGPGPQGVTLLIGPEGGLAEPERQTARRAGYRTLRLGPRVMRTETAAIAAVVAVQLLYGDL